MPLTDAQRCAETLYLQRVLIHDDSFRLHTVTDQWVFKAGKCVRLFLDILAAQRLVRIADIGRRRPSTIVFIGVIHAPPLVTHAAASFAIYTG